VSLPAEGGGEERGGGIVEKRKNNPPPLRGAPFAQRGLKLVCLTRTPHPPLTRSPFSSRRRLSLASLRREVARNEAEGLRCGAKNNPPPLRGAPFAQRGLELVWLTNTPHPPLTRSPLSPFQAPQAALLTPSGFGTAGSVLSRLLMSPGHQFTTAKPSRGRLA